MKHYTYFMSIHSLAKELGVSEYSLKKLAKGSTLKRKGTSRRHGYVFQKEDLEYLAEDYVRYAHDPKLEDEYTWIFYKKILSDGKTRFLTPIGRFNSYWNDKLEEFIRLQEYTSRYGKKANHFHIVGNHRAILRIKRIFNLGKDISTADFEPYLENLVKQLPLSMRLVYYSIKKQAPLNENQIKKFLAE